MPIDLTSLLTDSLYLLALINPVSKISVLAMFPTEHEKRDLPSVAVKASVIAFLMLIVFEFGGDFVLQRLFHVDLYSLQVAGGIVIFYVGFNALSRGVFYDVNVKSRYTDAAIVPLASPLIAGPATITAVIATASQHGYVHTSAALLLALAVNLGLMLLAVPINTYLKSHNIVGAIIRLTGLVVATMGVQMTLTGLAAWRG